MQNDRTKTVYAGFFVRLAAYIIDWAAAGVLTLIALIPISLLCGVLPERIGAEPILFQYTLSGILTYCVKAGYFIILTYTTGRTLGKRAMNLRVINEDGSRKLDLLNVIFRETIGRFLSGILNLGYILIGIDSDKRGLHDRLCDTLVIYEKEITIHEVRKAVVVNAGGYVKKEAETAAPVKEAAAPVPTSIPAPGSGFSLVKPEDTVEVPVNEVPEDANTEGLENKCEDQ